MSETSSEGKPLNPWFSMWYAPRATIQQIVSDDPRARVLLLASIAGFSQALDRASVRNLGDEYAWPVIVLICAVLGPISGIFSLYIGSVLLRWTGRWLGGEATIENIRAAMAWVTIPIIWIMALWIPELALFGQEMFTSETPRIDASPPLAMALIAFSLVEIVAAFWVIVIFLRCLGQVQGFSAWRALLNTILAMLTIILPLLVLVLLLV